ncbi:uncharacterized protein DS421_14g476130 [Arachis hypogaea]|nr:uncharacterized protein DS421_14g476130 [Arachis hypogaea]
MLSQLQTPNTFSVNFHTNIHVLLTKISNHIKPPRDITSHTFTLHPKSIIDQAFIYLQLFSKLLRHSKFKIFNLIKYPLPQCRINNVTKPNSSLGDIFPMSSLPLATTQQLGTYVAASESSRAAPTLVPGGKGSSNYETRSRGRTEQEQQQRS